MMISTGRSQNSGVLDTLLAILTDVFYITLGVVICFGVVIGWTMAVATEGMRYKRRK